MGDTRAPLEQHAPQLLAWAIERLPVSEQLRRLGDMGVIVGRQSLYKFHKRHAEEIAAPKAEAQRAVVAGAQQLSIANQGERLRRLDQLVADMEEIRTTRGLMATDFKNVGAVIIEVERFDAALVREYRAAMHDAAIELGQIVEKKELSGGLVLAVGLIDDIRRRVLADGDGD